MMYFLEMDLIGIIYLLTLAGADIYIKFYFYLIFHHLYLILFNFNHPQNELLFFFIIINFFINYFFLFHHLRIIDLFIYFYQFMFLI